MTIVDGSSWVINLVAAMPFMLNAPERWAAGPVTTDAQGRAQVAFRSTLPWKVSSSAASVSANWSMPLTMNMPRTATVTAITPAVVASCDRATFDEILRPLFADD